MRVRMRILVAIAAPSMAFVIVGWAVASVFMPVRPALTADQIMVLDEPARAGLRVVSLDCLEGQVPCLVVSPKSGASPGQRGQRLRQQLQSRGVALQAYGQIVGTVVLLHGRNSRKEHMLRIAERFAAAGLRCIIPDLPGHGDSPLAQARFGTSDFERRLPARLLADVQERLNWRPAPAFLWGYSMGGAVALHAAADENENAHWRGLVIVSSFDRLDAVVDDHLNRHLGQLAVIHATWFSPIGNWFGTPDIDSIQPSRIAPRVHVPTLVIHGDKDQTIDPARGRALYSSLGAADKQWITVPGAGHQDVFITDMPLFERTAAWMLAHLADDVGM